MSNPVNPKDENTLDMETINLLGANHKASELPTGRIQELRAKIMSRIDQNMTTDHNAFLTVRENEGDWIAVTDKIKKKSLFINQDTGIESFLLKVEPGASDEPHTHEFDELCYVIEGDVSFGEDINLKTGDLHIAPKGSFHEFAKSVHGALLLIQTGINANNAVAI